MQAQTFIFIGPPGSGKGTQAERLVERLRGDNQSVLYLEIGDAFRSLAKSNTMTGRKVKQSMEAGDIEPAFLSTTLWSKRLIDELSPDMHLVIDGSPRSVLEAKTLDEALQFYNRIPATVLHLTLSEEAIYERLSGRGRDDDRQEAVAHRLQEYRNKTVPALDFYKETDHYRFVQVDGEQSIADVEQSVQEAIS